MAGTSVVREIANKGEFGVRKAEAVLPRIDLLAVPYNGGKLTASYPAFGVNSYDNNFRGMGYSYYHSMDMPRISFRSASTAESIGLAAYDFGKGGEFDAGRDIFSLSWLQAGRIGMSNKGVYANIPVDAEGNPITNEGTLKEYLNKAKKVDGIWLVPNGEVRELRDFGFAPYESFERGAQEAETFVRGGLARVLEHTEKEEAGSLSSIVSGENYPAGINVKGFDPSEKCVLRDGVLTLNSEIVLGSEQLNIDGSKYVGDIGYAFGVLVLN